MSGVLSVVFVTGGVTALGIAIAFIAHQRRLAKHRGVSRDEFIGAFTDSRIPDAIPAAVYDYYKSQVISKKFGIAPDDDYEHVLSKGDEDIDDDAHFLAKDLGFSIPPEYVAVRLETRIRTLRDMVFWLYWVAQRQPEQ